MSAADVEYKRVLLLGSKRVGKSSLLGAALNGDLAEDHTYSPTLRVERFFDVERKLELIDAPGLDDKLLEDSLLDFERDPVIQEILAVVPPGRREVLSGVHTETLSAYVLVFCGDPKTQHMARCLWTAISSKADAKGTDSAGSTDSSFVPIFCVFNDFQSKQSGHPAPPLRAAAAAPTASRGALDGKRGESKTRGHRRRRHRAAGAGTDPMSEAAAWQIDQKYYRKINAKTFSGLEALLDDIAESLSSRKDVNECLPKEYDTVWGAETDKQRRTTCDVSGCTVA